MANVSIKNMAFEPETVTIAQGDSVTWTNDDSSMNHTATRESEPCKFDTKVIKPGASKTLTFDSCSPGSYPYICKIHPHMKGTVVIKP